MLVDKKTLRENDNPSSYVHAAPIGGVTVGDTVKIMETGQIGKVIGFENGKAVIDMGGARQLFEVSQVQKRDILFG